MAILVTRSSNHSVALFRDLGVGGQATHAICATHATASHAHAVSPKQVIFSTQKLFIAHRASINYRKKNDFCCWYGKILDLLRFVEICTCSEICSFQENEDKSKNTQRRWLVFTPPTQITSFYHTMNFELNRKSRNAFRSKLSHQNWTYRSAQKRWRSSWKKYW